MVFYKDRIWGHCCLQFTAAKNSENGALSAKSENSITDLQREELLLMGRACFSLI